MEAKQPVHLKRTAKDPDIEFNGVFLPTGDLVGQVPDTFAVFSLEEGLISNMAVKMVFYQDIDKIVYSDVSVNFYGAIKHDALAWIPKETLLERRDNLRTLLRYVVTDALAPLKDIDKQDVKAAVRRLWKK